MFVKLAPGLSQTLQREARIAFHDMPFDGQVLLIAEYTKEQLQSADTLIKIKWKDGVNQAPSASKVWRVLSERHSLPNAQLINACFPELRSTASAVQGSAKPERPLAEVLADNLKDLYEFWARRFYCYDQLGSVSKASVLASPARFWDHGEWAKIDGKTGLPGLGFRIKNEADFLASNVDQLVFR